MEVNNIQYPLLYLALLKGRKKGKKAAQSNNNKKIPSFPCSSRIITTLCRKPLHVDKYIALAR